MNLKGIGPYLFGSVIGEGTFSIVRLCYIDDKSQRSAENQNIPKTENKQDENNSVPSLNETESMHPDRKYYAAKIISRTKLKTCKIVEERFETEIRVMQQLHHPGVVQIIDLFKDSNFYYVIIEYCPHGNLFQFVVRHENAKLTEEDAKPIFRQVLETIQYLHSIRISHRDMKLENILLDSSGRIKISDFGLSKLLAPLKDSEIQLQKKKKREEENKKISIISSMPTIDAFNIPPPVENPLKDMPPPIGIPINNSLNSLPPFVSLNNISPPPQRRASYDTGPSFVPDFSNNSPLMSPRPAQSNNTPISSPIKLKSNTDSKESDEKPIEKPTFSIPPPLSSSGSNTFIPPPQLLSSGPGSPLAAIPPPILPPPFPFVAKPASSSPIKQIPMELVSMNTINPMQIPPPQITNLNKNVPPPLTCFNNGANTTLNSITELNANLNKNMSQESIPQLGSNTNINASNSSPSINFNGLISPVTSSDSSLSSNLKPITDEDSNSNSTTNNDNTGKMLNISSIKSTDLSSNSTNAKSNLDSNSKQTKRRVSCLSPPALLPLTIDSSSSPLANVSSNINQNNIPDNEVFDEDLVSTPCGSPCYASPECLSGKPYSGITTDMWSCGVILYEMLTGQLPWTKQNEAQMFEQIKRGEYTVPRYLSNNAKNLIRSLLTVNVRKRYNADQALDDDWLSQVPVQFPSCLRSNSHLSTVFLKCILDKEKEENGDNDNISLKLTEYTKRIASDHLYIEKRKVRRNRRANSHKVFRSQCVFSNDSFQSFKNSELTAELTEKEKIEFNKDVIIIKRQLQEALKSSGLSTRRRRRNTDFPALKSNDTNHFSKNSRFNFETLYGLVDKNVVSLKKVDEFFRGTSDQSDLFDEEFEEDSDYDIEEMFENHFTIQKDKTDKKKIIYSSMRNILEDFGKTEKILSDKKIIFNNSQTFSDKTEIDYRINNRNDHEVKKIDDYAPPILITNPKDPILV